MDTDSLHRLGFFYHYLNRFFFKCQNDFTFLELMLDTSSLLDKLIARLGMVMHICKLCTWRLKQEVCFQSETSLGYSRRQNKNKRKYSISMIDSLEMAMDINQKL